MGKPLLIVVIVSLLGCLNLQAQEIIPLQSGQNSSLRGLSVVDKSVVWVSGSNGYVATTKDGGNTWSWNRIAGYEKFDFRDIEAFSATEAVIVNAGSPAVILVTVNGGQSWKEVYRNNSPDIFLDGMDFWNRKHGIIYGDPIAGQMQLLETIDGGKSWNDISKNLTIPLIKGEASFAASGTAIRTGKKGNVWVATGGTQSRIFHSKDFAKSWRAYPCPIIQGNSSSGPFSIAFHNKKIGVAAGGDYLKDTLRNKNFLLTSDGGRKWISPVASTQGFRSAVEYITKNILIATGTSGTDISYDGGSSWRLLSPKGYNCVRRAKKGSLIIMTGSKGSIAKIDFNKIYDIK